VGCDWGVVGKDCGMLVCSGLSAVWSVMEGFRAVRVLDLKIVILLRCHTVMLTVLLLLSSDRSGVEFGRAARE
jgi:hypothetical protein